MFSSSILQMMKKIWEKKLSKVKQKSKPVPALEQPRVCCSRSLERPPRTSDNCLQIHIGSTHWPSRISIKFLGPYLTSSVSLKNLPTFAISISWTVISRLTHCHHLLAALLAEAHLVMIREYGGASAMMMKLIFLFFGGSVIFDGLLFFGWLAASPQPELPQHWSSLRCTRLCKPPWSPPLVR